MKKEPLCMTHETKADGSVPISEELRRRWGLRTGSSVVIRETNSSNRVGSSLGHVKSNLAALQSLRRRQGRKKPEVGIEFVMMRHNISQVPKLRTLAYELGATFIILTNVLPYTEELNVIICP